MSQPTDNQPWTWPLNLAEYDRTPNLTEEEKGILGTFVQCRQTGNKHTRWLAYIQQTMPRLITPLYDAYHLLNLHPHALPPFLAVFLRKMHQDQVAYWGMSETESPPFRLADWAVVLADESSASRYAVLATLYCFGLFNDWTGVKQIPFVRLAQHVFGLTTFQKHLDRVSQVLREQGYSEFCATQGYLPLALALALLKRRSPHLEDLTTPYLQELYEAIRDHSHRAGLYRLAYALFVLKLIPHPVLLKKEASYIGEPGMADGIHPHWVTFCRRWLATSTYQLETRKAYYRTLLQVGRWLAATHPDITSPADWTRELAVEYIAMVDDMRVGDWTYGYTSDHIGKPLSPATKADFINVVRIFCRDCQAWDWVKLQLDPAHHFAVPPTILAKLGPAPRVIADDLWAKIMWAGLNLTADDLLFERTRAAEGHAYRLEMVQAVAITWLFSGLRMNEICRLRLGCIRQQAQPANGQTVCLLTVPVNKTSNEYTKPVDPLVGRAIAAWEQLRPVSPPLPDRKTGENVQLLFAHRDVPLGRQFINETLIPTLCHKAGVPLADARGRITSHRARATIATQLYNAKEGMSLTELQAWLGHRVPESTQHYVSITLLKQAEAYAAAGYLGHNKRLIEVLIDQDVIRQGKAQAGEPWRYFDVGHGYCHYDFFDECPHRLACARCDFYVPKQSSRGSLLEAKSNLERMLQEIQLSIQEQAAVADGILVMEKLLAQLVDVPTPAGPAPRQIAMNEGFLVTEETQG